MAIDAAEQIEKFQEFIEQSYQKQLHENLSKGLNFLVLDFFELTKFDPKLADQLLEEPEETLKAAEMALEQFDVKKGFRVRFSNLPKSQEIYIKNLRSKHLNKFIAMEGIIRQSSEVRPQAVSAKFECPSCGNTITMPQIDANFREPSRCSCGRKGKFRLLSKELVDVQRIVIEESPENLEGGAQPKRMQIFLREDLVEPKMERRTTPGTRVIVNGLMFEIPVPTKTGGTSTRFDLGVNGNFVQPVEEDYTEINITPEDEIEIKNLAKEKNIYKRLIASIAPSIYGHDKIKEAIMLQMFGGIRKTKADQTIVRGDLHVLLVGDPGCGKSQMLTFVEKTAPKARYVAGRSASGAGLCVSPNSVVLTNPGGMSRIQDLVDERLKSDIEFKPGVWKEEDISDVKIQSMSNKLEMHSRKPNAIWKLEAPKKMFRITLSSGKKIELTGNTSLFSINNGLTSWKKSMNLKIGDYIATPRTLIGGNIDKKYSLDFIQSNPVVHNIKPFVNEIKHKLLEKYGSLRKASQVLKVSENQLYHHWVNDSARGNIKLRNLIKIASDVGLDYHNKIAEVSLYNGKKHYLPTFIDEDILYFAGLVAGDGHIRRNNSTYEIGFSNSSEDLHIEFQKVLSKFKLHYYSIEGNKYRSKQTRCSSKILGEILFGLGLVLSPKSDKIYFSEDLLHMKNNLLANYIAGLYDTDGSVYVRKGKGSSCIDLTTCSERLARQLQTILLRFNIHASIRIREPSLNSKIIGKHKKYILEIRSLDGFRKFFESIPLKHCKKKEKLEEILRVGVKCNTNIDIVPGISIRLKELLQKNNYSLRKLGWHKNFSRNGLIKILNKVKGFDFEEIRVLAKSDIFWEKIVNVEVIDTPYDYVYDLTVEDSHNFVVDGILVHNTCSVVKDEFLRGWALEAGAMVLADKGILVLDEMDKISKEDTSALHEAMEQQHISVAKANIQAQLRTQTSILAAANPKMGRFDPYTPIPNQIDLPPALINRFDLIFVMRDLPNKEVDANIASKVLESHSYKDSPPDIDGKLLRKYIAYTRQRVSPKLTDDAVNAIRKFYVELRSSGSEGDSSIKPIPISARQLEAVVRLAEASARIKLKDTVDEDDAIRAIGLLKGCMTEIGVDPDTGKIDIDRMTTGISASARGRIIDVREILYQLSEEKMGGPISIEDDLKPKVFEKGITERKLEEVVDALKKNGDFFEPKKGWLQKI